MNHFGSVNGTGMTQNRHSLSHFAGRHKRCVSPFHVGGTEEWDELMKIVDWIGSATPSPYGPSTSKINNAMDMDMDPK